MDTQILMKERILSAQELIRITDHGIGTAPNLRGIINYGIRSPEYLPGIIENGIWAAPNLRRVAKNGMRPPKNLIWSVEH